VVGLALLEALADCGHQRQLEIVAPGRILDEGGVLPDGDRAPEDYFDLSEAESSGRPGMIPA